MSDYRPWDLKKPEPVLEEPEPDETPEPIEEPAQPRPVKKVETASPEELETTKVVAAPGMQEEVMPTGDRGRALAASALLFGGGALFFGAFMLLFAMNGIIGVSEATQEGSDARDAASVRGVAVPLMLIASGPAIIAGMGLVYRQAWAKPFGQVVAGLQALTIIGIPLGAIALGGLAAWRPQ